MQLSQVNAGGTGADAMNFVREGMEGMFIIFFHMPTPPRPVSGFQASSSLTSVCNVNTMH